MQNFLLRDHKGYCEQFASAMAMMARVVGIPSRVSVGFLPGEQDEDGWKVSIRDMHAWPELYFANYGWVRFEPTPASVTGTAPAVDRAGFAAPRAMTHRRTRPRSRPTSQAAPGDRAVGRADRRNRTTTGPGCRCRLGADSRSGPASPLVLLLILAAPATIRLRRRSSRLNGRGPAEEQVEAAWAEIRDTVLDYGGLLAGRFAARDRARGRRRGLDQQESESMSRVATLVERSRYARAFADVAQWGEPTDDDVRDPTRSRRADRIGGGKSWRSCCRGLSSAGGPKSPRKSRPRRLTTFVAAATPALLHLVHESLAVVRCGSPATSWRDRCRCRRRRCRRRAARSRWR